MKKYLFIITGFILLFNSGLIAQPKLDTLIVDKLKRTPVTDKSYQLFLNMRDNKEDPWMWSGGPLGFKGIDLEKNPKFDVWIRPGSPDDKDNPSFSLRENNGSSVFGMVFGAKEIELASTSITKENANNYKYNVRTLDGEDLVPWSKPSLFRSNKFTPYAYLGKFNCYKKTIILTILETKGKRRSSVYVYTNDDYNSAQITKIGVEYDNTYVDETKTNLIKGFRILPEEDPQNMIVEIEETGRTDWYYVYLKRKYKGKVDTISVGNGWEKTNGKPNPTMHINSSFFEKPGRYTLLIQPEMRFIADVPNVIVGMDTWLHFDVPESPKTLRLRTVAFILFALLVIGLRIYFYMRRKNKLTAQAKEIAVLQLQSVRSQLNPHFIFNALAGIQNLMNKNEVENANKYLARFARLTRNVLDEGQKELTPIANEVSLLTDYLEMEQMRFGFKFDINVGEDVDQQIEIPAMLLQPFAENAVKHGISALKEDGNITVGIKQNNNDIILTVTDNGSGFSKTQTPGMGIKLCEERIRLLNTVYKNSTILLHINPTDKGTTVTIELKNWL